MRRFSKKIQQSGLLLQARSSRFKDKDKSRTERRKNALKRNEIIAEKEYQRKIGKLEDDFKQRRG